MSKQIPVQIRRTSVPGKAPTVADIEIGELAVNFPDQKLYTRDTGGNIITLSAPVASALAADIANVSITGGNAGEFLKTDGAGNLSWSTTPTGTAIENGLSNVSIPVANGDIELWVAGSWVGNIAIDNSNVTSNFTALGNIEGANLVTGGGVFAFDATLTDIYVTSLAQFSDVSNITILGGSNTQVLSTDGTGNLSWANAGLNYKYSKEWHVDPVNGDDIAGDGSYNKPFKTIARAISFTAPTFAQVVYLHAGTYSENVVIANPTENIEIIGVNDTSTCLCTGTWAFTHTGTSIRVMNLRFNGAVTQTSTGDVYFDNCLFTTSFTKSGASYTEFNSCSVTAASFTSNAATVARNGSISGLTLNNAGARVYVYNMISVLTTTVTAGQFYAFDTVLYSSTTTTNAVTSSAGTVVSLFRCNVTNASGTLSRVSLAGNWSINDTTYDLANSTLTGTNLGTVSYFDALNVRGNISAGNISLSGTGTTINASSGNILTNQITGTKLNLLNGVYTVGITGGSASANYTFGLPANGGTNGQVLSSNGANGTAWTNSIANANYANFAGTVITAAQPNITSVGTLTGLTVAGNLLPSANITYDLGSPTQRWNTIYLSNNTLYLGDVPLSASSNNQLTVGNSTVATFSNGVIDGTATAANVAYSVDGANVTGDVAGSNYANFAGDVVNASQPNITSVGNLTGLVVSGNALVTGNLSVSGNLTYIDVADLRIQDPVIQLGSGANGAPLTSNDGKDRGTQLHVYDTGLAAEVDKFMGWKDTAGEFVFGSNITNTNDVITVNAYGNVRASTFIGNLDGTAANATYATSAGNADTANSVDAANVTGTVDNANYAAYSATSLEVANGTSNVSIPVANGPVLVGVNGSPNIASFGQSNIVFTDGANTAFTFDLAAKFLTMIDAADNQVGISPSEVALNSTNGDYMTQLLPGAWSLSSSVDANLPQTVITPGFISTYYGDITGGPVMPVNPDHLTTKQYVDEKSYIANGTSNVSIDTANGRVLVSVDGSSNIASFGQSDIVFTDGVYSAFTFDLGTRAFSMIDAVNPAITTSISPAQISLYQGEDYIAQLLPNSISTQHDTDPDVPYSVMTPGFVSTAYGSNGAPVIPVNPDHLTTKQYVDDQIANTANANYANFAGDVVNASQPNITSVGTLTGLDVSGTSNLGAVANVKISGGSNGQVLSTNGNGTLSWTAQSTYTPFKYTKEFHVDTYNGNDTTGDGSYEKPYKTIMKAHSVMDGSGQALYIHGGVYSEAVTWTRVNADIIGINDGGISYLQGAWTVSPASSSVRIRNVMWGTTASLTHNSAGSFYMTQCTFSPITFTKSGSGYVQTQDCDFGSATAFNVSGAGQVVLDGGMVSNINISNASALVSTVACLNVRTVAVTAGIYSSKGSVIYSASNTANAITASAGTTAYLFETSVYTPSATPARVSLAGFNSINSSQYDAANSTISGTNLGTVTYWDAVNVRGVSTLGAVGNVRITGGSNNQVLRTNGSGTLSFANAPLWVSAPASNVASGTAGQSAYDAGGNLYICVAANTWSKITGTTSW